MSKIRLLFIILDTVYFTVSIIAKCRDVGADGVIILGFEYGGTKQTEQYQKAQAIKYID